MQGFLLFDIDGVIRDVSESYRLAIKETVKHFSGWSPTSQNIDSLKEEGIWNNDWDASLELLRRYSEKEGADFELPNIKEVTVIFTSFYFGGDPEGDQDKWDGFIRNEKLLIQKSFFDELDKKEIAWGFVSGAEPTSARFILEKRLGLKDAPLVAMGDAPSKPNPTGLLNLASELACSSLGKGIPPIAYLGDTVADVLTVKEAQKQCPDQKFLSLAIAPPHLYGKENQTARRKYESRLKSAGANFVLERATDSVDYLV